MIRAFVGIAVPEPLAGRLAAALAGFDLGNPVPAGNLHVTLAFLGEHPEPVLRDVHDGLSDLAGPAFALGVEGLGTFGGASPRALFAPVKRNAALARLRQKVRRAASDAGIDLPRERYHPHVTLARFGRGLAGQDVAKLQAFVARRMGHVSGSLPVTGFTLFESRLGRNGPAYEPLAEYELSAGREG